MEASDRGLLMALAWRGKLKPQKPQSGCLNLWAEISTLEHVTCVTKYTFQCHPQVHIYQFVLIRTKIIKFNVYHIACMTVFLLGMGSCSLQ